VTGRGAKECTFRAILKAVRAYFKAVFRMEQMCKHVINALKMLVNPTITISSIINVSI